MPVGKGSILRAANAADAQEKEKAAGVAASEKQTGAVQKAEKKAVTRNVSQHENRIFEEKGSEVTSLKDEMPVYLL